MNLLSLMYTVGLLGQDRWDPQNYFLLILVLLGCLTLFAEVSPRRARNILADEKFNGDFL